MNKGNFIESVFIEVNGGTLSDSSAVRREDISAYLPIAVNYAMAAGYNNTLKQENSRDISGAFTGSFFDLPIIRTANRTPHVVLPKGTVALARDQGIRYINDGCGGSYTPLMDADRHTVNYYKNLLPKEKFFRLTPKWIDLFNINPLMETLKQLDMIVRTEDLDDTDELPLHAGVEILAMEQCIQKFGRQRQNPSDKKIDAIDINTIPQP